MALEPQKLEPEKPVPYIFEDRPEVSETFADSIHSLVFDGQTLRITFTVTRIEPPPMGTTPTSGRRLPSCRLVLTGGGIAQLMNQIAQLNAAMAQRRAGESAAVQSERG
jgi:hypothetical protein